MALPVIGSLDELAEVVGGSDDIYVRWSAGPDEDQRRMSSRDGFSGARLPGLSADPLRIEDWWGDRPRTLWLARRLQDYAHLPKERSEGVRPWILRGEEQGRGPDNEPLVACREAIAWIEDAVLDTAARLVSEHADTDWGPLDRG